jgi:hypothetical protein
LTRPEVSLVFHYSFICYHGFSDSTGNFFHSVSGPGELSDGFSQVLALAAHVIDRLSQPKGLASEHRSLEEKDQGSADADADSPPIRRCNAELLGLFVVGVALVFLGVEYIELANKQLCATLFVLRLFLKAAALELWFVAFLCQESRRWPI